MSVTRYSYTTIWLSVGVRQGNITLKVCLFIFAKKKGLLVLLHQVILFSQYLIHCFSPQGNFHHWRPLLLHFDTYFKTYLSCRNDLTLLDNLEVDSPLPKHDILQILRVMQIILENCPNKSTFDGIEVSWTDIYFFIFYEKSWTGIIPL